MKVPGEIYHRRNLIELVEDYLKIIPVSEETSDYRDHLIISLERIRKRYDYASPEEIGLLWDNVNYVLTKHNNKFIKQCYDWATAILYICRYEYDNIAVKSYLNIISHEY